MNSGTGKPLFIVACALCVTLVTASVMAQGKLLRFAGWGGVTQDAERKSYFAAAATDLGVKVEDETHNGYATIKTHVTSGARSWDVIGSGMADCVRAGDEGLLDKIDYSVVQTDGVLKEFVRPYCVGLWTFSYGITYRTDVIKNGPKNWAEFWDVKKFPGRRSLFAQGRYAMEVALMADGVPPSEVYKLLETQAGVDRAFRKLEQIKPHIDIWWTSQGQVMQLVKDKEVDILLMANGRAGALAAEGVPLHYEYNQAILDAEAYFVPKGTPNAKLAMEFINNSLKPEPQAKLSQYIPYGPTNTKAYDTKLIPEAQLDKLPTAPQNVSKQIVLSPEWYASKLGIDALARIVRLQQ